MGQVKLREPDGALTLEARALRAAHFELGFECGHCNSFIPMDETLQAHYSAKCPVCGEPGPFRWVWNEKRHIRLRPCLRRRM